MDCWNIPWIRKIILCFAPQTGKTQVAFNCLGYAIDQDPGPAMYVMPDERVTKRISRRRIIPMIRNSPRLSSMLSLRSFDTTSYHINFRNGMDLMMAWATSAAELSSESVRYLFMDETDKWPEAAGREVDPIALAEVRTNAYPHTKKILYLSTPTDDTGIINQLMEKEADEVRRYHVPCPVCGEYQRMVWENITWPKDVREPRRMVRERHARYACNTCGMLWTDAMRNTAVRLGIWKADKPLERPLAVAFHLPSWYSPFLSMSEPAAAFLRGKDDPGKHQIFITQHKAEPWRETVEEKEEGQILRLRTDLAPGIIPEGALALTCGIDMQHRGFWFVVRAWAADLTSWLIQYGYLSSWDDLESLLFKTRYPMQGKEGATLGIWRAAIDTGGGKDEESAISRTEEVYQWLRKNGNNIVFGTKGASRPQIRRIKVSQIDKYPSTNRSIPGGLDLRLIDTSSFKYILHWRLERNEGESQTFHLHKETKSDYAKQILAEQLVREKRSGKRKWKAFAKDNHLLDCEVLAAACADPEWIPSLQMLVPYIAAKKDVSHTPNLTKDRPDPGTESSRLSYRRPSWLDR